MGKVDAQSQSDNHSPETVIVHRGSSRKIVHHSINHLQRQRLKSKLCAVETNFPLDLLFEKIPTFQFNGVHLGESHSEREGKTLDHVTSPWEERDAG